MILLIHGNDSVSSRKFYNSQKDNNSLNFDAEDLNLIELAQSNESSELFTESKKIFIDNLFTKKGIKKLEQVIEILNSNEESEVYLYANREIEAKNTKKIKNLEIRSFKIPQNIWNFLNSIKPNSKNNVLLYHQVLNEADPDYIFAMIIRQFRLLIAISSNSENSIDEIKRSATWQKSRLKAQASLFTLKELKIIYKKLFEIDKNTKTGRSNLSLSQNIDFLLSDI